MRNFRITIQYEGSRYQGWQRQKSTDNTLQGKFETLLSRLAGETVEITASGRTDAGVHARGQVANFHMNTDLTASELLNRMNQYLPEDVAVVDCREVEDRFHSRLCAKGKCYQYRVLNSPIPHVFDRRYVYQMPEALDLDAMRRAAGLLTGTHDFKSFTSAKRSKKSTVRTIFSIEIEEVGEEIRFTFCGDGFLFHMVRILVGTLLEVGKANLAPSDVEEILAACDRQKAGPLVPASGLCLMEVYYS